MIRRLFFLLSMAVLLLSACSDNDSFSSDSSYRLTFTKDTLLLDTLFTTVPSSTYTFWVYNNSSDGIRITTTRLERGNQSGFRVNVDGTFLNPAASDLEVRKGDSIRVFVELTAHENMSASPKLVEDNLLFSLESGVEQRVNLRAVTWDATKMPDLIVTKDMTIDTSIPLILYGKGIQVNENATLTIKNTVLFFHDGAGIKVNGKLVAEGCLFRGDRLDRMFPYLPYDRVSGQWKGLTIAAKAKGCEMKDSEIHSCDTGLSCDSTTVILNNVVIHNCNGYGLYAHDSDVTISQCQMTNTLNDCLLLAGCKATVDKTTLAQFYPLSAERGAAFRFKHTEKPLELSCTNTLVTGYADDVVMGEGHDGKDVFLLFDNNLLRTPAVDDANAFKNMIWEKKTDAIQGSQHFKNIDADNLYYDFHIKEESPAYARGIGRQ